MGRSHHFSLDYQANQLDFHSSRITSKTYLVNTGNSHNRLSSPNTSCILLYRPKLNPFLSGPPIRKIGVRKASVCEQIKFTFKSNPSKVKRQNHFKFIPSVVRLSATKYMWYPNKLTKLMANMAATKNRNRMWNRPTPPSVNWPYTNDNQTNSGEWVELFTTKCHRIKNIRISTYFPK